MPFDLCAGHSPEANQQTPSQAGSSFFPGKAVQAKMLIFAFMICLAMAAGIRAQVGLSPAHPNLSRGFGNNKTVEKYEWDSINLFNGNLNVTVPVGIRYSIVEDFSYQFGLNYNSNVWDLEQMSSVASASPVRNSNAGLGWDLSFGRLLPPYTNGSQTGRWAFVSSDGSLHPFYSTLHYDTSESDPSDAALYTRDGTYYRLRYVNDTTRLVESPDGLVRTFEYAGNEWRLGKLADRFNNSLTINYATPNVWTITDKHGRAHTVQFKADLTGYYPRIVDRITLAAFGGATATYTFVYTTASIARPSVDNDPATSATVSVPLLSSITQMDGSTYAFTYHPAGASAESCARLASMKLPTLGKIEWTYQPYNYKSPTASTSLNPIFQKNTGVATRRLVNASGSIAGTWTYTLGLLPAGAEEREMSNTVKTPLGDKTVYYFSVNTLSAGPEWTRSDYGLPLTKNQFDRPRLATSNVALASSGATATASSVVNAGYPALGAINGDRKGLNWGNGGGWNDGTTNWWPDSLEVAFAGNKTIDRINVFTLQDNYNAPSDPTTDMTFTLHGIQGFDVQYWNGAAWATVSGGSVTGNDKVWRQFAFSPITTSKIRVVVNKSLNMSSRIVEVEAFESSLPADARFLSKQVYDCDSAGNNCRLLQSTYVRYEQDEATDPALADTGNTNRRESSHRIVYHDDVENGVARFADTDRSNFDGLGHYRQTVTNGNFGNGDVRTWFLNYDKATGAYPSAGYVMPSPTSAWILNTVSQLKITEGQSAQVIEFCYDSNTGFLKRTRQWWSTNPAGTASANDVVTVYTADASGQAVKEQYYGGDVQLLNTNSLCVLALPATDQYQIQHTYQNGRRSSSQYATSSGTLFASKFVDRTIDRNTGLIASSRDISGISTSYEYDAMGRRTWVKPESGHGAWQQCVYAAATAMDTAKKLTYRKSNGGATQLSYNAEVYDSFGRLASEQTSMPGATPNRYTSYNALGWVTQSSEYSTDLPTYTEFLNYDPFGRPGIVRPPDGSQHDVTFEYAGVRNIKRTSQVGVWYNSATGQVIEQPRSTLDVYDRQGRLWQQVTPSRIQNGTPEKTIVNVYDVTGRLVESRLNGELTGSRLNYDGRGFLFSVQDSSGAGPYYRNFDAAGNALTQRPGLTDLSFLYDRARRLIRVQNANDATKLWKEFVYADSNGIDDWRKGKLWTTRRYNYLPNATPAIVSETNTYGGQGGRLSRYEIELADGVHTVERFAQTYSYDETGSVAEIGYPNSSVVGSSNLGRDRRIINNYDMGFMVGIAGSLNSQSEVWASSVTYHPDGLISRFIHGNGVTDNIAKDQYGFMRVSSFSTAGVKGLSGQGDQNCYSGNFQYDGSGNLVRIGNQFFLPTENQSPPASPIPPDYTTPCQNAWVDPFNLSYGAVSDGSCMPTVLFYYTATDRLFKLQDNRADTKTWYFTDLNGRRITEARATITLSLWLSTRDYIYSRGVMIAIDEALSVEPFSRTFHFSKGYGSSGIVTDQNGYRTQLGR